MDTLDQELGFRSLPRKRRNLLLARLPKEQPEPEPTDERSLREESAIGAD